MSTQVEGKDYFFRGHFLTNLQIAFSLKARWKMFLLWRECAKQWPFHSQSVLDVGTTPDTERADSNCHIPWLLDLGVKVELYSPEDISALARYFPGTNIIAAAGNAAIPVPDQRYDWAMSSATLEHVGDRAHQVDFIRELGRISRAIFLTTPNRGHWLEFHTKLPFLHWLHRRWHQRILRFLGLNMWASESHLRLVSKKELLEIAFEALGSDFHLTVTSIFSLGMPSNLILLARRTKR